jgi:phage terminase large subunit-like protein
MSISRDKERILASALKRLETLARMECLDPIDPNSRPTMSQNEVIADFGKVKKQFIRAGNQCLAEGTLVLTSKGIKPIEQIEIGEEVFSEYGKLIKVVATYDNGIREVRKLTHRGNTVVEATDEHVFLTINSSSRNSQIDEKHLSIGKFSRDTQIQRVRCRAPLGTEVVLDAYALGALLGDGCSTCHGVVISSEDSTIPNKVGKILHAQEIKRSSKFNHSWTLKNAKVSDRYNSWIRNRLAHEKIVDLEDIQKWDRNSVLNLVAGVVDTDGSVFLDSWNNVVISIGMQAKSVIEFIKWAFLTLWQVEVQMHEDSRPKYVHGPLHCVKVANNIDSLVILSELTEFLAVDRKQMKEEYLSLDSKRTTSAIGVKVGKETRLVNTYDITVDSDTNLYCLANGLVTHNSGKTSVCVRNLTWFLSDTHPHWKMPTEWRNEPLLAIICGRTGKQIEESLLPRIIRLLEPGSYKEIRIGNMIQRLELNNGNRVVFQSLENPSIARERLQSYTAHLAWVDELPPTLDIIFELFRCVQARDGMFMASFTPLVVNVEIQRYIDAVREPLGRVYRFQMLDNPIYKDETRQNELLESFRHLPDDVRRCRLYGDWMSVDDAAYHFNYDKMVRAPEGYSQSWRHVESSDPATESALGMTIWAEDPHTGFWYCMREELLTRIYVPTEIVKEVRRLTSSYNIVRRISDPAATWYMRQAAHDGLKYIGVYSKNNRNVELIKQFQEKLGTQVFISPWCTKLIGEIQEARWSDRLTGKIVGDNRFHLTASARYFCDNIPSFEKRESFSNWDDWLYRKNEERKVAEDKQRKLEESGKMKSGTRMRVRRGRGSGGGLKSIWH